MSNTYEPKFAINVNAKYIGMDKFKNHTFGLDESTYISLKNLFTKDQESDFKTPLSSYEYSGKTYFNLKVKERNVPAKLEKNKSRTMKLESLFFTYNYLGKNGLRVVIQDYKVIEEIQQKFTCASLDDIMG